MRALVVYESMYGNTRQVAEAVADGIGRADAEVLAAHEVGTQDVEAADLIVLGGPTHAHGMSRPATRRGALDDALQHPDHRLDGDALSPGVRELLAALPEQGGDCAAAFDTRLDKPRLLTGSAARGIAHRLRHSGRNVLDEPASFLVAGMDGPLLDGELDRAREWGAALAAHVTAR